MAFPNPSIDATDLRLAAIDGPMRDGQDDRSTYLVGRRRTRRKGSRLLQLFWEWTFFGTAAEWDVVRALLEGDSDGEFDFAPRGTYSYRCRCTSELPALTPLYMRLGSTGEPVFRVEVRVEAVELVSELPPIITPFALFVDGEGAALVDSASTSTVAFQ